VNIALTGGMGCGKSTALAWLRAQGIAVFESDGHVRSLMESDTALHRELREAFGPGIFRAEGGVDRPALGSIVFSDPSKLKLLEELVHPRVRAAWLEEVEKRHPCLVVEIPLLFEKDLQSAFDLTCCVVSDPKIQFSRLRARGWTDAHIAARLSCQWSLTQKAEAADVVILNDGSRAHLEEQLARMLAEAGG
jgi:dephospho-CoA kinase